MRLLCVYANRRSHSLNKKIVTGVKVKNTGESKLNGSPGDDDHRLILQWKNYIHSLYYPAPCQTRGASGQGYYVVPVAVSISGGEAALWLA